MYLDGRNQPLTFGPLIAKGGEGAVFPVVGRPEVVAKVYHAPIAPEKELKLQLMSRRANDRLAAISAWPMDVVRQAGGGRVVGLLMPRVERHREVHHIYSPADRKNEFPELTWKSLVHVAMNCAAAFKTIHAENHVIGDVNQGGVFVSPKTGTVRLIDCDSFQIVDGSTTFFCTVGVPLYTPPEMVGRSFTTTIREPKHDNFGLALLIFHLLFMGRHPFSGRYLGPGDMPIEQAILARRYAFARDAQRRLMAPPPRSVGPLDLCPGIAEHFERAFTTDDRRPSATEWHTTLKALRDRTLICAQDNRHAYSSELPHCPWCRTEQAGLTFFVSSIVSFEFDVGGLFESTWLRIDQLVIEVAIPSAAPAAKSRRGKLWPAEANPYAAGSELPVPAKPAPPVLEPLPDWPAFVEPAPPPSPELFPIPVEPPLNFRPSPEPVLHELPQFPEFKPLTPPPRPTEPDVLPVRDLSGRFDEVAAKKAAAHAYGRSRRLALLVFFRVPLLVAITVTVAAESLGHRAAAVMALLCSGVLLVALLVVEDNRFTWQRGFVRRLHDEWEENARAEKAARDFAVTTNELRRVEHARALVVYEAKLREVEKWNVRKQQEVQEDALRVAAERDALRVTHAEAMKLWAAAVATEETVARSEWQSRVKAARAAKAEAETKNNLLWERWRSKQLHLQQEAKRKWEAAVASARLDHERVKSRNADRRRNYDGEIKAWEKQVECIQSHNGAVHLCRARWKNEVSNRRREVDRLATILQQARRRIVDEESPRMTELRQLKTDARSLRDEFVRLRAEFEKGRAGLSAPIADAQRMQFLESVLIREEKISHVGAGRVESLAYAGVETANDISEEALDAISGFKTGKGRKSLLAWRAEVERRFVFDPKASLRPSDLKLLHTRFKGQRAHLTERLAALEAQLRSKLATFQPLREKSLAELEEIRERLSSAEADLAMAPNV